MPFDFSLNIGDSPDEDAVQKVEQNPSRIIMFKNMTVAQKLWLMSEKALSDVIDWHLEDGHSYHFISAGDVDSLTFLRHILKQQKAHYVLLSTWCMATSDAEEMSGWVDEGLIKRLDFYVGEIFKNGYRGCLDVLMSICDKCGGRVAMFKNHSKVIVVLGERFDCVIESSANVNTNPRTEQTCITVDSGLCDFYIDYFDGIRDFDGRYKDWSPYERGN